MTNYRALILNPDNSILSEKTISATDPEAAIAEARKLVDVSNNIELWDQSRMIALLTRAGTITSRSEL